MLNIAKFVFSKKALKIDKIFTFNLTVCSECQMEDFVLFCGCLRKHDLYDISNDNKNISYEAVCPQLCGCSLKTSIN